MLERLVHVTRDTVPADRILIPIEVPDSLIAEAKALPPDWADLQYGQQARTYGDRWVTEQASAALLVPSVVVPAERNLLLDPLHPGARRIKARPPESFAFDRRLLR